LEILLLFLNEKKQKSRMPIQKQRNIEIIILMRLPFKVLVKIFLKSTNYKLSTADYFVF